MSQQQSRREFWRSHHQQCKAQRMTLKAYAEQKGLTLSVFYGWSKRFRQERESGFSRGQVGGSGRTEYRLHFPNGLVQGWNGDADSQCLALLVKSLA
ncbi:MAG: hypothetical protein AB2814_00620 [Candidatus Sedimenticola endophacoides]